MIALVQDYYCDPLSMILGWDAVFGNSVTVDSYSYHSGDRIFKTSETDHAKRNGPLDTSDLIGAL